MELLCNTIQPESAPATEGKNLSESVAVWPGAIVNVVGLAEKAGRDDVMFTIVNVSFPAFVKVTVVSLDPPSMIVPQSTNLALNPAIAPLNPFPETAIVSGDEGALL
jgi:hypothetical protein